MGSSNTNWLQISVSHLITSIALFHINLILNVLRNLGCSDALNGSTNNIPPLLFIHFVLIACAINISKNVKLFAICFAFLIINEVEFL